MLTTLYSFLKNEIYFFVPFSTGYTTIVKGLKTHHHLHPIYHLFVVENGSGFLEDDHEMHELKEKDIVLINPNERHIFSTPKKDLLYFTVNFYLLSATQLSYMDVSIKSILQNPKNFESHAETGKLHTYFPINYQGKHIEFKKEKWKEIKNLCQKMNQSISRIREPFSAFNIPIDETAFQNITGRFFQDLCTFFIPSEKENQPLKSSSKTLLQEIYQLIHEQLEEEYSLTKLAQKLGYHTDYIRKYFKQKTNDTITHYVNQAKINRSCEYLKSTNKSITEISYLLNFSSSQHFSRNFKAEKGITPKEYRKKAEEE